MNNQECYWNKQLSQNQMLFGLQKQNSETRNNYLNNDYITDDQNNNFLVNDETEQVPNKNQLKV
jgi:hypothetical protein